MLTVRTAIGYIPVIPGSIGFVTPVFADVEGLYIQEVREYKVFGKLHFSEIELFFLSDKYEIVCHPNEVVFGFCFEGPTVFYGNRQKLALLLQVLAPSFKDFPALQRMVEKFCFTKEIIDFELIDRSQNKNFRISDNRWTETDVGILRFLWGQGCSASFIAKYLGKFSRNMIIGKAHSIGLPGRNIPSRPIRTSDLNSEYLSKQQIEAVENSCELLNTHNKTNQREGFLSNILGATDLEFGMCKWPIGDPTAFDFTFCGDHVYGGSPYCERHYRLAYFPNSGDNSDEYLTQIDAFPKKLRKSK